MSNKWDKMDDYIWKNSEVMQELEKIYLDQKRKNAEDLTQKTKQLSDMSKSLQQASNSAQNLKKTLTNLSEDDVTDAEDEHSDCSCKISSGDSTEETDEKDSVSEYFLAKSSLLTDLTIMKEAAIDEGDIITTYNIERLIAEVEEG